MSAEVERWQEAVNRREWDGATQYLVLQAGDALAAALKAKRERIAELEAGLREIAELDPYADVVMSAVHLARALLERKP